MKHLSQNYKTGAIRVEETDWPALRPGGALVRTHASLVSIGTEAMKAREGKLSYLGKARARPDQVKKVIQSVQQQGLQATYQKVMNRLDARTPLGYSLAGEIVAVGAGAEEYSVGALVACAGAGYANHADVNFVPKNLIVPVPDGVALEHAAFTTVGAIAMQGYRQAAMQLGETACVIGLGLIGQLLVQLLNAAGVRVVGIDLSQERCDLARHSGANAAFKPDDSNLRADVLRLTGGIGVDCVFLAAGGSSNRPVEIAAELARDRARVVDIGKTRLDLPWKDYYEKELDVRFSRSYGPGRYDPSYEERGVDYPIGYVRWTERRNMAAFLDLVATGRLHLDSLITARYAFSDAERVYEEIATGQSTALGVLFTYPSPDENSHARPERPPVGRTSVDGALGLGVIGAGNYASSMLLPHLQRDSNVRLVEVATATPLSAKNAGSKFGFVRAGTDYKSLLAAEDVDAVLIATRHAAHPTMASEALSNGKAVFVEKPLAIDLAGLELVRATIADTGNERIHVGFNRRFAPLVRALAKAVHARGAPLVMTYRVHAGQLEPDSWYLNAEHGSRFAGEAGHFLDVFAFLTRSRPASVFASTLRPQNARPDDRENVVVTVTYEDGSVATLQYLTQGAPGLPKEYLEVHGGGLSARLDNFKALTVFDDSRRRVTKRRTVDKGQEPQLAAFVRAVRAGTDMPIGVACLIDTTLATLAAARSAVTGQPVSIADMWQDSA